MDYLKKYRNSFVAGSEYSDYNKESVKEPMFLRPHRFDGRPNSNLVPDYMNTEVASLDVTILQLEVNYEKLLTNIHTRSLEIYHVAQSLVYDIRDSMNLCMKTLRTQSKKHATLRSKVNRMMKKENKGITECDEQIAKANRKIKKLETKMSKLQEMITTLIKEKGSKSTKTH